MRTRWKVLGAVGAAWAVLRPFRAAVEGDSMAPTLSPGDYLVATRTREVRRGHVVVVRPAGYSMEMVKRVVGLPGERVRLEGGAASVDGLPLHEPYASGTGPSGEWRLGSGEYLVLGDNRDRSTDGRAFGPVGRDALVGRVRLRYWPGPGLVC